jgi:amino acid permease
VLGSGVLLGLPFCFRSCGALLGSLLLALCAAASLLSAQLLLAAAAATGSRSYEGLATAALGARAGALVAACVWALQLGSVVASVNIMADLLSAFAGSVVPPGAEPSRQGIIAAVVALALLPLALAVRSPRSAAALSGTAAAFVAALVVAVVTHAAGGALAARSHAHARAPLALWRAEGAPVALPVLVYALSGHALLFPVYASLKAPTPRRMAAVSARALGGAAAVYAVMGLGGYAAFRERTSGDVLRNFGGAHVSGAAQAAWRALKLAYGLSVAAAVPLALLPLREALTAGSAAAAGPGTPGARRSRAVLRHTAGVAGLLAAVLACALAVPNLEFVFALTGATACVLLSYILPAAIYLGVASGRGVPAGSGGGNVPMQPGCGTLLCGDTGGGAGGAAVWLPAPRRTAAAARCLLLAGILAAAVCTRATLSAVAEEADTVQLARALVKTERVAAAKTQKIAAAAAVVAQLDGLQDAAAALSAARVEAAEALTHMRSVVADTFSSSSSDDPKPAATAAHAGAGGAALEGAAAALAAAHSKVDARLAGVVSAAQALNDVADGGAAGAAAAAAAAAAVVLPASPPPMPPPPPAHHATAEEQSASHAALEAALAISMRAGAPEVRPLHFQEREEPPPPPPSPPPSPMPPPGGAAAGASMENSGVRARANATVAALAETAVALDAVQRAANRAAGAAARGGSGGGAGKRAADVDNAVADAGAALSAADASLSALQAAAGSQAAEAERALVDVLLDAAAPEATAAALAVLRRDAETAAKPAKDGTQLPLPLPLPTLHLRHRSPPPPAPRLNATAAAAAAVQAVARTTAKQAGITVRHLCDMRCDVRACGLILRILDAGGGARGGGGDASRGDCAPAGGGRCAGGGGGGGHSAAACRRRAHCAGAAGAGRSKRKGRAQTRQRPQRG